MSETIPIKPVGEIAPACVDENGKLSGFVHSIETGAAVDGPGMRFVLFVSGCQFRCLYCHNPDTWTIDNSNTENLRSVESLLKEYDGIK